MKWFVPAIVVGLALSACGSDDARDEVAGPTAPYVERDVDPCTTLSEDAPQVSDAVAGADNRRLGRLLGEKGVRTVGLSSCGRARVIVVGVANDSTRLPARAEGGTPILTQQQPPIRAL